MSTAKKKRPDRLDRYVSMLKQKEKDATGSEPAQSECAPGAEDCPTAHSRCESKPSQSSCSPPNITGEHRAVETEPQRRLGEHPPTLPLTYTNEDTPQRKFSGWVRGGLPEGEGSLWSCHEDGAAHEFHGQFANGVPSGTGFHVFPDGGKLSCSWTRGCPVGAGHLCVLFVCTVHCWSYKIRSTDACARTHTHSHSHSQLHIRNIHT
jgi:hypothetical protein